MGGLTTFFQRVAGHAVEGAVFAPACTPAIAAARMSVLTGGLLRCWLMVQVGCASSAASWRVLLVLTGVENGARHAG